MKRFGDFSNGISSVNTISRVIGMINPKGLQKSFIDWMQDCHRLTEGEVVAIDGKTLRGSYDKSKSKCTIHMVYAFATRNGVAIERKHFKEQTGVFELIEE